MSEHNSNKNSDNKRPASRQGQGGFGMRRGGFGAPVEKAKDFKGSLRRLVRYLGAEKFVIMLITIVAIISTILFVIGPRVLGEATDEVFTGLMLQIEGIGSIDFSRVAQIMLFLVAIQVISIVFDYAAGFIMAGVSARITYRLRTQMSDKIHSLPFKYFDKTTHGDVLSRISNDVDTISNTLNQGMGQLVMRFTQVVGIIIMMVMISPWLTLVAMAILPLSGVSMAFIVKRSQKYFKVQQESLGSLNGHIEEMFTSHAVVKAFNGERASVEAFDIHNKELYQAGWKANFLSGMMMPIIGFISNLGYVGIVVAGGAMAVSGRVTLGGIQAFIQYSRRFGQPVAQLSGVANILQQTAAAAERVFAFLDQEEESPEHPNPFVPERISGKVAFEHVYFGYDPEVQVIKNFTAEVKPGQKIAIVGHTGAGKTTIVKLLMRFYDIAEGGIYVDGVDISHFTRDGLRSHFGMVLQDTWLFNGTIQENIRYGRLDATDDEIKEAAKAAQAHHFVRALPDGYQMTINEEADNISAGQKQLLTIARTILANPDILILDEATSNVDTRTEVHIQKAMDNLMRGRTSFVIAHRLSTIRSADLILVMKEGDIVEQGNHEDLLEKGGVYADLYNSQFDVVE